ncbi:hypothetical protein A2W24_00980 [Microgenomates group bacterium RBG_16_45_19]|nr:MAG: hypothetical protein A2W24_00980 [Microgenomates group bacterium RBG_16_45_19]
MPAKSLATTYRDLAEDAEELAYLADDFRQKCRRDLARLKRIKAALSIITFNYLNDALKQQIEVWQRFGTEVDFLKQEVREWAAVAEEVNHKLALQDLSRVLVGETAGLIEAANWQSPSFDQATSAQAGLLTGKIKGNLTDYTRDQQIKGNTIQKIFGQAYYGLSPLALPQVLMTASGMAALTTIITMLLREKQLIRPVLVGRSSYFQNQELLLKMLPVSVTLFDENKLAEFKALVKKLQPAAVFVDSLANNAEMTQVDLLALARTLSQTSQAKSYLVTDTSCQAFLAKVPKNSSKVKVISWESLNKYYQFGLDQTTGGVIKADPGLTFKLFEARMHGGTILTTRGAAMLPTPNRRLLLKRLKRLERNATKLATEIKGVRVVYPTSGYRGGFLVIRLPKPKAAMKRILAAAKEQKVPLVAGSSFGLNITRIYVVAMKSAYSQPFLRLSAGTESWWEIERLLKVINQGLRH